MVRYKFSDIAYNVTDKKMPEPGDEKCYIGLEHLDSGSLNVTRWGGDVELKGQKLLMKKGDVLFGRRNTYLRRAAIAPHDGIFSAHGMILRPKTEIIDPDFFPFFIASDYFMDSAIRISVGSLSPTVNWRDLKELEFVLPDKKGQKRLGELLCAANDTKEAYKKLLQKTDDLVKSQFIEMFGDPMKNPMGWPMMPLMEAGTCKNGVNFASNESGTKIHCLGVGDFKDLSVINDVQQLPMISLNEMPSTEYCLRDEDIVFVRSNGNKALVGRCLAIYPGNTPTTYSGFCIRFRKDTDSLLTEYLLQVFKAPSIRLQMAGRGANIQNLNQQILAQLNIPLPPLKLQNEYVSFAQQVDKSKFELQQTIEKLDVTIKLLMQQDFS